jgi:hypothetical protein
VDSNEQSAIQNAKKAGKGIKRGWLVWPLWLISTLAAAFALHGTLAAGRRPAMVPATNLEALIATTPFTGHNDFGGMHPLQDTAVLVTALAPENLASLSDDTLFLRVRALIGTIKQLQASPVKLPESLLPSSIWFQARLVTPRDAATMLEDSRVSGAYGRAYTAILKELQRVEVLAPKLEKLLELIWRELTIESGQTNQLKAPLARADRWMPPERTLNAAHQYALDVFFTSVKRNGVVEHGPPVYSMSNGIVVAASDDWQGGDRPSTYESGGLSPKAGNGAIVYCPADGRYYAYFHMDGVVVRSGDVVEAGQLLGNGGNTGTNARKRGHGTHLHIEIHEASGRAWTSYEIRRLLVNL